MERDKPGRPSKVPDHLKPFLRPSLTTEPVLVEDKLTLRTSPPHSVELCPPNWRLPPKRSLRHTLKAIVLKEWPVPSTQPPRRSIPHDRPFMMRMKDSDDYITARAANPRTGLISPSVGSPTPRAQNTPDSPGEALYMKEILPQSPTPDVRERPVLRKANEGRKLIQCCNKLWKTEKNGWLTEVTAVAASPKITRAEVEVAMPSSRSHLLSSEDALVVHMPSAQEPQPYAYPGYSAKQIEAAEFYQRKARKVSSGGYDQRTFYDNRLDSPGAGPSNKSGHAGANDKVSQQIDLDRPGLHAGYITVAKRRIGSRGSDRAEVGRDCPGGASIQQTTFAPFISPKTAADLGGDGAITELQTAQAQRRHQQPLKTDRDCHAPRANDLKRLPRIALVHPTLAALPQTHPHRQQMEHADTRRCSFECESEGNVCIERRSLYESTASPSHHSLFDQVVPAAVNSNDKLLASRRHISDDSLHLLQPFEILATAIIGIVDACRNVVLPHIPRLRLFDILQADDQSPQQKVDALKCMLSTAGQALLVVAITAALWHVGSAILHAFEVVLWPVLVPFKILRWLGGGRG